MLLGGWLSAEWPLAPLAWGSIVYGVILTPVLVALIKKHRQA
jgi:hypothetical protein